MAQFSRWNELAVCILPLSIAGAAQEKKELTAGELTENETPAKAIRRTFETQEYEFRSAAKAMPATTANTRSELPT